MLEQGGRWGQGDSASVASNYQKLCYHEVPYLSI